MEWVEWWISSVVHHEDRIISPKQHKKKTIMIKPIKKEYIALCIHLCFPFYYMYEREKCTLGFDFCNSTYLRR